MKIWWVTRHFLFWSIFSGLSWLVQHLVSWCMWCLCISHMGRTYHFMPFFFIASNSISSTYDHIKEIKRHKTTCLLTPIVVGTWKRHLFLKFEWCYSANRNTSWGIIGRDVCIMSVTYTWYRCLSRTCASSIWMLHIISSWFKMMDLMLEDFLL
jgi:hypothetical protein